MTIGRAESGTIVSGGATISRFPLSMVAADTSPGRFPKTFVTRGMRIGSLVICPPEIGGAGFDSKKRIVGGTFAGGPVIFAMSGGLGGVGASLRYHNCVAASRTTTNAVAAKANWGKK